MLYLERHIESQRKLVNDGKPPSYYVIADLEIMNITKILFISEKNGTQLCHVYIPGMKNYLNGNPEYNQAAISNYERSSLVYVSEHIKTL